MKDLVRKIFRLTENFHNVIFVLFIYNIISSFIELSSLFCITKFLQLIISNENIFILNYYIGSTVIGLNSLSIIIILLLLIKMIFAIFLSNYTLSLTSELEHDFRMKIVRYYLNLDVEEFVTESVPDMINRIKSHVNEFVYNGVLPIIRLINEFIVTIFFLVYLFFTDPISVILLFITLSLFIFIYTNLIKRRITQASTDATKGSIKILDLTYNFINGFREILVYNKQDYFIREIERNSRSSSRAQKTHLFYTFIPRYILEFFIFIFIFLLHFTSTYLDSKSSSLVNIGVFGFIALRLIPSLNIALQASSTLRYASVPVERLHADVKKIIEKSKIVNDKVFTELNDKSKFVSLELKNVDFSYNNNKLVLNGLSIKIVSNEFIGIVGESGSGKSTLIDVILGLRKIRNGEYLFNNLNYRYDYSISDYFSYIPQDYFLLDDTLLTNITLENSSQIVNKVKLDDAIEMSQLTNFVKELDDGLSFIIGNGGRKLSGGQRQRLALARAFYFSREILVFDEPTSSLDPDTAKKFMEYLIDLKRTRTVILITHDYDLLRYCDKYFTLRNGNLEETKNYYS